MTLKFRFTKAGLISGMFFIASQAAMADVDFIGADAQAKLTNNNTTAIVTGAVTCSDGDRLDISAVILQNNKIGQGQQKDLECTGLSVPFSVQVKLVNPPGSAFKTGAASLVLSALTADPNSNQFDLQTVTVSIKLSN